ncbi:MAG TPA: DUF58 domain-containing protein [Planctomycetota bacterium]|nr:DUF58 domain-containing protein [Planctomycetota bacterium]
MNPRGWIYLALTVSVAFAAGFKGNNLLFAIFCVLFGLFLVCAFLTVAVARRMELSRILPEAVCAGELFTVGVRLRNSKRLWPAFCLKVEDRLTHEGRPAPLQPTPVWLPLAKAGARIRGSYYLTAHERGWAKLGPFAITSEFPPGLFTYRHVVAVEDRILVFPRMGTLNRRVVSSLLSRADYTERPSSAFETGDEEFASLREYREGDSPRRIHWKMSARLQGKLLVREYENAKVRDAIVLLDTFLPNPNDPRRRLRLERAVTFAATLVEALLGESYTVTFKTFAPDPISLGLEPRRGALDELLGALALLKPSRVHSLADLPAADDEEAGSAVFLLRIGNEPYPRWENRPRTVTIDPSDMKKLMVLPP